MSRSESLGSARAVELSAGEVAYRERGAGEPIVFIHGVLMNADAWAEAVPLLAPNYRCIAPDWPTGGHGIPLRKDAALTPSVLCELVEEFLAALELADVTLVGIGLGTVICELMAIRHPERLARIVFASGDILSTFPPRWARVRFAVAHVPALANLAARALNYAPARAAAYRRFAYRADDRITDSFSHGVRTSRDIRRDTLKLLRAIRSGETGGTRHCELRRFKQPALVLWGRDDRAFPASHPDELAAELTDVRVQFVDGARTFVAQDQPAAFAAQITDFIAGTPANPP